MLDRGREVYCRVMVEGSSIGGLARAAGVPVSTLRYWEREGLLQPDGRTVANYRWYGPDSLERARFIRTAQAVGFTLSDVRELLALQAGRATPCRKVRPLVEKRLAEVDRRIDELRSFHETLGSLVTLCRESAPGGPCPVVSELDASG